MKADFFTVFAEAFAPFKDAITTAFFFPLAGFAGDGFAREGFFDFNLATTRPNSFRSPTISAVGTWYANAQWTERWLITHKWVAVNNLVLALLVVASLSGTEFVDLGGKETWPQLSP